MKRLITLWLMLLVLAMGAYAKADKQTVLFQVDIHCQGCIDKIMHNIAFEKGVKDIQCSLEHKTVEVKYDANKTNIETLQEAFQRIKKPAIVLYSSLNPEAYDVSAVLHNH